MKPSTRTIDYVTLVQDGVMTLDDVPQDVRQDVTKWVRRFQGYTNGGVVKDTTTEPRADDKPEVIKHD